MALEKSAAPISRRGRRKPWLPRGLRKWRHAAAQGLLAVVLVGTQTGAAHTRREATGRTTGARLGNRGCQGDARTKQQRQHHAPVRQSPRHVSAHPTLVESL